MMYREVTMTSWQLFLSVSSVADTTPFAVQAEVTLKTNFFATRDMLTHFLPLIKAGGKDAQLDQVCCQTREFVWSLFLENETKKNQVFICLWLRRDLRYRIASCVFQAGLWTSPASSAPELWTSAARPCSSVSAARTSQRRSWWGWWSSSSRRPRRANTRTPAGLKLRMECPRLDWRYDSSACLLIYILLTHLWRSQTSLQVLKCMKHCCIWCFYKKLSSDVIFPLIDYTNVCL